MTTLSDPFEASLKPLINRLTRDVKAAATQLSDREARYLVDLYYTMQDQRIRVSGQERSAAADGEPCAALSFVVDQARALEERVKSLLDSYSTSQPVGVWSRGRKGIGPVLAAGLMAHIDIEKAPTYGNIWSFAGLNPTVTWGKGEKRPYNMRLKVLCWKIGESFVKQSGREDAFYGALYKERKQLEEQWNAEGRNKEAAEAGMAKYGKTTEAYKHCAAGHLPPAHVHARAKRWVVKLFLSHWHHVAYASRYGKPPARPYPVEHMGHAHVIEVPGFGAIQTDE